MSQDSQSAKPVPDEETIELATKLFNCARLGDTETFREYLPKGLPPNLCNQKGDSLLMLASYHGHVETTRVLLEHGADPEMYNDNGHHPLSGAAFKGHLAMAELLITHGASVNARSPDDKTALMFAAMFDNAEIVEYLLAQEDAIKTRLVEEHGMEITEPADGEQAWIEQATAIWPDFYDSIGGKAKLDEALAALGREPAP